MTDPIRLPKEVANFIEEKSHGDRSVALAMKALVSAARDTGEVPFNDVAIQYRNEHLAMVREAGGDADHEAGRLSLDEVRIHLAKTVLPKLVNEGLIMLPPGGLTSPIRLDETDRLEHARRRLRCDRSVRPRPAQCRLLIDMAEHRPNV